MKSRILVLIVTAVQVLAFGLLIAWSIIDWSRVGWVGLAYQAYETYAFEDIPMLRMLGLEQGEVSVVGAGSPAARAGIRRGDRIVGIAGVNVIELAELRRLGESSGVGDQFEYRFARGVGEETVVTLRLDDPYRSPYVIASTATTMLAGLACLGIGLVVLWRRPGAMSALLLYSMCSVGAVATVMWAVAEFRVMDLRGVQPIGSSPWVIASGIAALVLMVVLADLLFHFVLVFPRRRPILDVWPQLPVWIHVAPFVSVPAVAGFLAAALWLESAAKVLAFEIVGCALVTLLLMIMDRRWRESGPRLAAMRSPFVLSGGCIALTSMSAPVLGFVGETARFAVLSLVFLGGMGWMMLVVLAISIATCVVLHRSYRDGGAEEKMQLRWLLWGSVIPLVLSAVLLAVAAIVRASLPDFDTLGHVVNAVAACLSMLSGLLMPLSFARAVLTSATAQRHGSVT
jgi:hypothetical protein